MSYHEELSEHRRNYDGSFNRGYGGGAFGIEEIQDAIEDTQYNDAVTTDVSELTFSINCILFVHHFSSS